VTQVIQLDFDLARTIGLVSINWSSIETEVNTAICIALRDWSTPLCIEFTRRIEQWKGAVTSRLGKGVLSSGKEGKSIDVALLQGDMKQFRQIRDNLVHGSVYPTEISASGHVRSIRCSVWSPNRATRKISKQQYLADMHSDFRKWAREQPEQFDRFYFDANPKQVVYSREKIEKMLSLGSTT
jgi:hypothetical protein